MGAVVVGHREPRGSGTELGVAQHPRVPGHSSCNVWAGDALGAALWPPWRRKASVLRPPQGHVLARLASFLAFGAQLSPDPQLPP